MTPEKAQQGLIFLLEHLKQMDAQYWTLQADVAALRSCVSLYPEAQSQYAKALTEERDKIASSLQAAANTYDAIILELNMSGDWTH